MTSTKRLKATHSGELHIGNMAIPCHVLEDGSRVISGRGMQNYLGFSKAASGLALPNFVDSKLTPYLSKEVIEKLKNPTTFDRVGGGGSAPETHGNDPTVFVDICDAIIEAGKQKGLLSEAQQRHVHAAEILIRSLAKVGIVALVDEATGYQEIRDKDALKALLDKYLLKEHAKWAKRFPDDFYKDMFRLKGWQWQGMHVNRPSVVGRYTNDLVYERLAPSILEELQKKNPKDDKGQRLVKHHQFFTDDIGHPALSQHIHAVMGFMRASTTWDGFLRMMNRAFPKKGQQFTLLDDDD